MFSKLQLLVDLYYANYIMYRYIQELCHSEGILFRLAVEV